MDAFFNSRTVAVVGVSDSPDNLARSIVQNLHEFSFDGIIYQVGPRGGNAFGRRIHRSVSDIPDAVDLAVVLVPARFVPGVLEECGQKGIRRVIIESAGFGEYGPEGVALQQQVLEIARRHGIRFIGPNGIGVANFKNGLVLPFARLKDVFRRGRVSILSQSGGVGLSYLNVLASENLGVSKFVSIGNKLDINECDLLEYLNGDPETDIIVMYLEGISDGRRLMDIARKTSKPILLHKSNIGSLAREIAQSHTASLSGDDAVVTAALSQVGIARFDDADTLVNYLKILPLPRLRGNRLAIISRSGGHAVMAADACEKSGFELAPFPEEFLRSIEKHFRASVIRLTNPLDLGDLFDFDMYVRIIEQTLRLPQVDGVVFLHTYIAGMEGERSQALFRRIEELTFQVGKPVAICVATDHEELNVLRKTLPHPVFTAVEDVIHALSLVRDFHHDARPEPRLPAWEIDRGPVRAILERALAGNRPVLLPEALAILRAARIPVADFAEARNRAELEAALAKIGGPAAVKLSSARLSHKSDLGGVQLNVRAADATAVWDAMGLVAERAEDKDFSLLVQPMVTGAREVILGLRRDPNFGPVILVGLGGIFVEVFRDAAMRVVPCDEREIDAMIRSLKSYPLLKGVRGQPVRDIAAIRQALVGLSHLAQAFPEISELDINPLMVFSEGKGATAVDCRVILKM